MKVYMQMAEGNELPVLKHEDIYGGESTDYLIVYLNKKDAGRNMLNPRVKGFELKAITEKK